MPSERTGQTGASLPKPSFSRDLRPVRLRALRREISSVPLLRRTFALGIILYQAGGKPIDMMNFQGRGGVVITRPLAKVRFAQLAPLKNHWLGSQAELLLQAV